VLCEEAGLVPLCLPQITHELTRMSMFWHSNAVIHPFYLLHCILLLFNNFILKLHKVQKYMTH